MSDSCFLNIYGFHARIQCASPAVLAGIREDFAFFEQSFEAGSTFVQIELFETDPLYENFAHAGQPVFTPRNVSYRSGGKTFLDYSGRALGIHDPAQRTFQVYSRKPDLLYEATYLFLLAQAGESFDARHLHRVHALGVAVQQKAALILLPMGGGKSTLGSVLLQFPEIQLLSDDSPLIDREGTVWAFPLRLGLLPGFEGTIPPDMLRKIQRMEFGPKLLVNYGYFANRVVSQAEPCLLFLGSRSLRNSCEITPASRTAALRMMISNCVIGLGLFQGMEFVFQRGWKEIFRKGVAAWSRLRASWRFIRRCEVYHLTLGRDLELNGKVVVDELRRCANKSGPSRK